MAPPMEMYKCARSMRSDKKEKIASGKGAFGKMFRGKERYDNNEEEMYEY